MFVEIFLSVLIVCQCGSFTVTYGFIITLISYLLMPRRHNDCTETDEFYFTSKHTMSPSRVVPGDLHLKTQIRI